jgi:hypothetical protein
VAARVTTKTFASVGEGADEMGDDCADADVAVG